MKRNQAWFSREIQKRLKSEPTKVFRYDLSLGEILPAQKAFSAIKVAAEKDMRPGKANQPPRQYRQQIIRHPIQNDLFRMSFSGPEGPQPIKTIARQLDEKAADRQLHKLEDKYSPELYNIEQEVAESGGRVFEVWLTEDWIQQIPITAHEAISGEDAIPIADINKAKDKIFLKLAKDRLSRAKQARSIGKKGGEMSADNNAHCSWPDIVKKFTEYKGRNRHTYTTAAANLAGILGYAMSDKLGKRIKGRTGMTPAKWYSTL